MNQRLSLIRLLALALVLGLSGGASTATGQGLGLGIRTGHWIDALEPGAFDQTNSNIRLAILGTSFVNPSSCAPRVDFFNLATGLMASFPADIESLNRINAVIPASVAGTPGSYAVSVRFFLSCGYGAPEESKLSNSQRLEIRQTDFTEPDTVMVSAPNSSVSTTAAFQFSGTDNFTLPQRLRFHCSLDAAPFAPCPARSDFSGLSLGAHTLVVRAVDQAGNSDSSPATHTWEVWPQLTNTTITSGPADQSATRDTTVTFTFTGSDDETPPERLTFDCSLDSINFVSCTSPQTYSNLAPLGHLFRVRARDAAGNVDPSPASRFWYVDTVPPDTQIVEAPPGQTRRDTAIFVFTSTDNLTLPRTFECKLDAGEFAPCRSPQGYSGLAPGRHTFWVRAKDGAGNLDDSPNSHTWTIQP